MSGCFSARERFERRHNSEGLSPGEVLRRIRESGDQRDVFHKDRDKLIYSPFLRRLAGVTQIMSPGAFGTLAEHLHNRLTHTLEVAQIARRLAERAQVQQPDVVIDLGGVNPDVAEAGALAHDLGHPPFGHHGERVLRDLMTHYPTGDGGVDCGGFEGNAQSFRIVAVLSSYIADRSGGRVFVRGMNLTRASYAAMLKYPWQRMGTGDKFGTYSTEDDLAAFNWVFQNKPTKLRSPEAEIMDFADDVAYSIFDVYDFVRQGKLSIHQYAREEEFEAFVTPRLATNLASSADILGDQPSRNKIRDALFGTTKDYSEDHAGQADLADYASYLVGLLTGDDARSLKAVGAEFAFQLRLPIVKRTAGVEIYRCAEMHPVTQAMIAVLKAIVGDQIHKSDKVLAEQESGTYILRDLVPWVEKEILGYIRNENNHLWLLGPYDDLIRTSAPRSGESWDLDRHNHIRRLACDIVASFSELEALQYHKKFCPRPSA